jgi:hypothetical protein
MFHRSPAVSIDGKVIIGLSSSEPFLWLKVYQKNQAHGEFMLPPESEVGWVKPSSR